MIAKRIFKKSSNFWFYRLPPRPLLTMRRKWCWQLFIYFAYIIIFTGKFSWATKRIHLSRAVDHQVMWRKICLPTQYFGIIKHFWYYKTLHFNFNKDKHENIYKTKHLIKDFCQVMLHRHKKVFPIDHIKYRHQRKHLLESYFDTNSK